MGMFKPSLSIRQKITIGYYICLLIILSVALLTYFNLLRVEKKVEFAEVVEDFFNTTLEARRFEKNYFLYDKEEDYKEHSRFVARAFELLQGYPGVFDDITPDISSKAIKGRFEEYRGLMEGVRGFHPPVPVSAMSEAKLAALKDGVRLKGKEITSLAERMSSQERKNIRRLLVVSKTALWSSILVLIAVGVFIGQTLAVMVVRPLKLLESYTKRISRGEFVRYEGGVNEKEVDSLLNAFNRMTAELEARQHQLVLSEKLASLGTLLSGVAHELNNPLSNISTSAQILSEEISEGELEYKKELIGQIEGQSDRARDIVRTLLEFSRQTEFKPERLSLVKSLQETIALIRGRVPTRVLIRLDVPEELELVADKQRIQQVFINLLNNAVDAVGEEGKVEVSGRETEGNDGARSVEIIVGDTGTGIPPERIEKVFDPFFTTKDVGKGSGLGLFIVHDIIERHEGTITVESRPGSGTAFTIRLPQPAA